MFHPVEIGCQEIDRIPAMSGFAIQRPNYKENETDLSKLHFQASLSVAEAKGALHINTLRSATFSISVR